MANNKFIFDGMAEFREALRNLPEHLKDEAGGIVAEAANDAAMEIIADYPEVSGNLKGGVKVTPMSAGKFGAGYVVKSAAPHAFIWENGTQARHTDLGYNRGAMPPGHVFIPICIRKRREMNQELVALLEREGFTVLGGA